MPRARDPPVTSCHHPSDPASRGPSLHPLINVIVSLTTRRRPLGALGFGETEGNALPIKVLMSSGWRQETNDVEKACDNTRSGRAKGYEDVKQSQASLEGDKEGVCDGPGDRRATGNVGAGGGRAGRQVGQTEAGDGPRGWRAPGRAHVRVASWSHVRGRTGRTGGRFGGGADGVCGGAECGV